MSLLTNLSPQQLRRAAELKEEIQSLRKEFNQLLGFPTQLAVTAAPKKRRKMSAAAKAKISVAAKARWAKVKGTQVSAKPALKAKRKMSAAARQKISVAAKARWAKIKAGK
jgi:hypothetical protein